MRALLLYFQLLYLREGNMICLFGKLHYCIQPGANLFHMQRRRNYWRSSCKKIMRCGWTWPRGGAGLRPIAPFKAGVK